MSSHKKASTQIPINITEPDYMYEAGINFEIDTGFVIVSATPSPHHQIKMTLSAFSFAIKESLLRAESLDTKRIL